MSFYHIVILALIQGLTEFLPVSSSAHLELLHKLVGPTEGDLALDVAVHLGTLGAVMLYFRRDVAAAFSGFLRLLRGDRTSRNATLALNLIVATIPVVVLGAAIKLTGLEEALRSLAVIAWAMILFGILLWWMDRHRETGKGTNDWSLKDALLMGLWQALALIPGTSRSGAAITGGLALGYARGDAARIAMLMSIPTIAASGVLLSGDVIASGDWHLGRAALIAMVLAFLSGLLALSLMMRLLRTVSFTPYVIYRIALGVILLGIAYT